MPENVTGGLLGLHAQTSLHPGSGTALGTVDLPVQRERHTQWPTIAGSALKGILRDAVREKVKEKYQDDPDAWEGKGKTKRAKANSDDPDVTEVFGPATAEADKYAGALSVTDARLLAFPVRSLKGVFAWATCPHVLERLKRDAALAGAKVGWEVPSLTDKQDGKAPHAQTALDSPLLVQGTQGKLIVLEEFEFLGQKIDDAIGPWIAANLLSAAPEFQGVRERFPRHLVVLPDDDFTHFARHATEVMARVGLNYETKTVAKGALFYQEFLPPETLFYSVVLANPGRTGKGGRDAAAILATLKQYLPATLQVGGDETTGKGYCATRFTEGGK